MEEVYSLGRKGMSHLVTLNIGEVVRRCTVIIGRRNRQSLNFERDLLTRKRQDVTQQPTTFEREIAKAHETQKIMLTNDWFEAGSSVQSVTGIAEDGVSRNQHHQIMLSAYVFDTRSHVGVVLTF